MMSEKKTFAETYMFKKMFADENFSYPPPEKIMVRALYPQSFFKLQSQSNKNMLTRPGEEQRKC